MFEQAGKKSFFLTRSWFANFERTVVRQNEQVLIYTVESVAPGGRPMAILPLKLSHKNGGVFSPWIMGSLSNYYSCYFEPIIAPDADNVPKILACLALALWEDRKQWDMLDLKTLPAESPLFPLLAKALSSQGLMAQRYYCFGNRHLDVGGRSYAEYFQGLPTVLRKNIPYMVRKIQKTHCIRMDICTNEANLDASLAVYEKLYLARWKQGEPFSEFITGLITKSAQNGTLRLGMLFVDDEPAAVQLWFVDEGIASIYKTAYDPRFSNLSVGNILTAHLMRHVIDLDKVKEVDYLSGDDSYKKDWMPSRRERWGIMAFNPLSFKGLVLAIRHIGGRHLKDFLVPTSHRSLGSHTPPRLGK